jgi:peptidoglycan hydrolase CwlO-like protein
MFGEKDRELEKNKEELEKNKEELEKNKEELEKNKKTIDILLQEKAEIAKKMKQRGMLSKEISEITGLTPQDLEKL